MGQGVLVGELNKLSIDKVHGCGYCYQNDDNYITAEAALIFV